MRKADNLPPYRAVVMKSGSLNFLEPSGPAQACYGRASLFTDFHVARMQTTFFLHFSAPRKMMRGPGIRHGISALLFCVPLPLCAVIGVGIVHPCSG